MTANAPGRSSEVYQGGLIGEMRLRPSKFRDLSLRGRLVYGLGGGALLVLVLLTLVFGSVATTISALILVLLYGVSAPFVIGGRWRTPAAPPARRPVVRKRRY